MAGAGWRDFVPGEVLTAANVQDYLQDQAVMVFASAAARTSALASPTDGMVSYLKDTDRLEIYTTEWTSYTPGLVPISPTSVEKTVGTASVNSLGKATFTGCQFMTLNGVFSSAYQSYLIQTNFAGSTATGLWLRLRASGTDSTASYMYGGSASYENGVTTSFSSGSTSSFNINSSVANGSYLSTGNIHVHNPASATETTIQGLSTGYHPTNGFGAITVGGRHAVSTAYDGISVFIQSGTANATIQVFGYND